MNDFGVQIVFSDGDIRQKQADAIRSLIATELADIVTIFQMKLEKVFCTFLICNDEKSCEICLKYLRNQIYAVGENHLSVFDDEQLQQISYHLALDLLQIEQ